MLQDKIMMQYLNDMLFGQKHSRKNTFVQLFRTGKRGIIFIA